MKKQFGQNLSQIGALYDFYSRKNLGRQSSGIELSVTRTMGHVIVSSAQFYQHALTVTSGKTYLLHW